MMICFNQYRDDGGIYNDIRYAEDVVKKMIVVLFK